MSPHEPPRPHTQKYLHFRLGPSPPPLLLSCNGLASKICKTVARQPARRPKKRWDEIDAGERESGYAFAQCLCARIRKEGSSPFHISHPHVWLRRRACKEYMK